MLRTVWTGAVATVTAGGLLLTAPGGVPAPHGPEDDGGRPVRAQEVVAVEQADTVPQDVSPSQIEAVLERAERHAREQGPDLSPTVAQAAAELGMLYTTYTAQQLALTEQTEGLHLRDAPVARASEKDDAKTESPSADVPAAVQVSYVPTSATGPGPAHEHAGQVTYDEVVAAAVRLANLLDAPVPDAQVEVQRDRRDLSPREVLALSQTRGAQESERFPLRESLVDAVTMFGGSTLGYANGRIPAAVLCPLDFAPGHMLRCDAAERLTALSGEFEREFGYAIPITDSYRSYVAQVAVAGAKPHLAAVPGTSNHGWGLAVDLSDPISGGASPEYVWLRVHGPDYGWDNPSWARLGGSKPEPWHFEFFAAGSVPNRAIDPSDVGTWGPTGGSGTSDSSETRPRHEAAGDDKPEKGSAGGEVSTPPRKPADKPADKPSAGPPSQKPTKPAKPAKPTPKPTPSNPRPTTPPVGPSPSPSPSPSFPSQEPSAEPSPSPTPSLPDPEPSAPAPTPSEPSAEPTAEPEPTPEGDGGAPSPSPSASASDGPLSGLARDLGITGGGADD
jgi:hypothetical protein